MTSIEYFEINPTTAPIVKEVFQSCDAGMTIQKIASSLNERGLRTSRNGKFTINITTMFKNRRYLGEYCFGDTVIPNGMPAIVS